MHSLTELTSRFARRMVARRKGYVLNVASAAAFLPSPYVAAYAATKSYVLHFSEALTYELRDTGVSVTTLYPGITPTEFNEVAGAKTPGLMALSILTAEDVARIGLRAMFARRRAVVPGWINRINAVMSHVMPRGLIVWITGRLLGAANGW
jgi:short-subunit dehydrogenase